MKYTVTILAFLLIGGVNLQAQNIKATTQDGKEVILAPNGTWKYSDPTIIKTGMKPVTATKSVKSTIVKGFEYWMDAKKWVASKKKDTENAEFQFNNSDGNCSIIIFTDKNYVSPDNYAQQFVEGLHQSSPDAKLINEEKRIFNGVEVRLVAVDAVFENMTFRYYVCFYSGKKGTTQIISYTALELFPQFEKEIVDFMTGFVIKD